jgi:hypothetical protein
MRENPISSPSSSPNWNASPEGTGDLDISGTFLYEDP